MRIGSLYGADWSAKLRRCPVCRREFMAGNAWVYKLDHGQIYCSYKCLETAKRRLRGKIMEQIEKQLKGEEKLSKEDARAVALQMHEEGATISDIAEKVGYSDATVRYWIKKAAADAARNEPEPALAELTPAEAPETGQEPAAPADDRITPREIMTMVDTFLGFVQWLIDKSEAGK